jgi:hypothetical protein
VYTEHVGGHTGVDKPVGGALWGDDDTVEGGDQRLSVEGR